MYLYVDFYIKLIGNQISFFTEKEEKRMSDALHLKKKRGYVGSKVLRIRKVR